MKIAKIDENLVCEYDPDTLRSKVYCTSQLENCIRASSERLTEIPAEPSDAELLEWARKNYPRLDYSKEKQILTEQIEKSEMLLAIAKGK